MNIHASAGAKVQRLDRRRRNSTFTVGFTEAVIMPRPLGGGIMRRCCLTSVCLSVAYIGPKSTTERPRKTKIGTEVVHVTRDSDTIFKVKRSRVKVIRGRGHIVAACRTACCISGITVGVDLTRG